ncbi:MAG TPA: exosortase-associated EpsI family protein [Phycisphaerales bacterium]|nr:exosortase-associated EpsI family protein [Phycisphaerales bacterium]
MSGSRWPSSRRAALLLSLAVLFGSAAALGGAIRFFKLYTKKLPIQVTAKCASVPATTAHWERVGGDEYLKEEVIETLGTTNYVSRTYVERQPKDPKSPRGVQFHLAYYTGMIDTVPHVPDRCFVAGGAVMAGGPWVVPVPLDRAEWTIDPAASADVRDATGERDVAIYSARMGPDSAAPGNRVRLPRGIEHLDMRVFEFKSPGSDEPMYSGYFFIANGALTSLAQNVRLLAFDLRSDYAYYMKVQFTATRIKGPEELAKMAGSLLDDLLPDVMLCTPDWTEVVRGEYPADNPRRKTSTSEHRAP